MTRALHIIGFGIAAAAALLLVIGDTYTWDRWLAFVVAFGLGAVLLWLEPHDIEKWGL